MREQWADFYAQHHKPIKWALLGLAVVLFHRDWLMLAAVLGGIGMLYAVLSQIDDENPVREMAALAVLGGWMLFCWQAFAWIVEHESAKAQTFCGKITQSETRTAARQRSIYHYVLENEENQSFSFSGHDYAGSLNNKVCVRYIPAEKSMFFGYHYVLEIVQKK